MMTRGYAVETIAEIGKLMTAKSIYPPSALHLLHLVNGLRCEICTQNPDNHVRKGYAIFVGWNCTICRDKTTVITGAD